MAKDNGGMSIDDIVSMVSGGSGEISDFSGWADLAKRMSVLASDSREGDSGDGQVSEASDEEAQASEDASQEGAESEGTSGDATANADDPYGQGVPDADLDAALDPGEQSPVESPSFEGMGVSSVLSAEEEAIVDAYIHAVASGKDGRDIYAQLLTDNVRSDEFGGNAVEGHVDVSETTVGTKTLVAPMELHGNAGFSYPSVDENGNEVDGDLKPIDSSTGRYISDQFGDMQGLLRREDDGQRADLVGLFDKKGSVASPKRDGDGNLKKVTVCGCELTPANDGNTQSKSYHANDGGWAEAGNTKHSSGPFVHCKSDYLGEFDYDANLWTICYRTDGNVKVPCLRYIGPTGVGGDGKDYPYDGILASSAMPDGIKSLDYSFAGSDLQSVPDIPNSVESCHATFAGCKRLSHFSSSARQGTTDQGGRLEDLTHDLKPMPNGVEDMSYMFYGCEGLSAAQGYGFDHSSDSGLYPSFSANVVDARGAFDGCRYIDASAAVSKLRSLKYLTQPYMACMFDETSSNTIAELGADEDPDSWYDFAKNPNSSDVYADVYSRYSDYDAQSAGIDADTLSRVREMAMKRVFIRRIESGANPDSELAAMTNGVVGGVNVTKENGQDSYEDTYYAKYKASDARTYEAGESGGLLGGLLGGDIADRGLAFLATGGLVSAVTGSKLVGFGGAAALQVLNIGSHITPLLDSMSEMLGKDSAMGKALGSISHAISGEGGPSSVKWTHFEDPEATVEGMVADRTKVVERMVDYDVDQFLSADISSGDDYVIPSAALYPQAEQMRLEGADLAEHGNMLTIAYTDEAELRRGIGADAAAFGSRGISAKYASVMKEAGDGSKDVSAIRDSYRKACVTLVSNVEAYGDGIRGGASGRYLDYPGIVGGDLYDTDVKKAIALRGCGKVMRTTVGPMYEMVANMAKSDPSFVTDEFLAEMDAHMPYGCRKFSEYYADVQAGVEHPSMGEPERDVDVEAMKAKQTAIESAKGEERKRLEEETYDWLLEDARNHGVEAQSSSDGHGDTDSSKKETSSSSFVASMKSAEGIDAGDYAAGLSASHGEEGVDGRDPARFEGDDVTREDDYQMS